MLPVGPALSQPEDEARLGGGSDIAGDAVIVLPQGITVPPIHFVFADNPEDRPIDVEFRAEAPQGIEIRPEKTRFTIPPNSKVEARFGITVRESAAAGDYPVSVQLVRTDIEPKAGRVTNVPAVGAGFRIRVAGEAATILVKAQERATRKPVEGTIVLSALQEAGPPFEVNRAVASSLTTRVAPGRYEATYLLVDRRLATSPIEVEAGQSSEVTLAVETVSFPVVAAKAVSEGGRIVVADLVASVQNQLAPISGDVRLRVRVAVGGRDVGEVLLRQLDGLPVGVTDAKSTYRPEGGWSPGTYRFRFELVTSDFTLEAADQPSIDVPSARSVSGPAVAAAAAVLVVLAAGFFTLRRRRLR